MRFAYTVEKMGNARYLACCDELNAVADGATKDEAVVNLGKAIMELLAYGGYPAEEIELRERTE